MSSLTGKIGTSAAGAHRGLAFKLRGGIGVSYELARGSTCSHREQDEFVSDDGHTQVRTRQCVWIECATCGTV